MYPNTKNTRSHICICVFVSIWVYGLVVSLSICLRESTYSKGHPITHGPFSLQLSVDQWKRVALDFCLTIQASNDKMLDCEDKGVVGRIWWSVIMCWCGLDIDWACSTILPALTARRWAKVSFILIFNFVVVLLSVVVYEATRAWRPVPCMCLLSWRESLKTSRASNRQQQTNKSSQLTLGSNSNSPRKPKPHFPELTSPENLSANLTFSALLSSLLGQTAAPHSPL